MGAKDSVTKNYLSDNRRFADLCNYYLFDGENVIRPEDLKEQDITELLTVFGNNSKQKWRDLHTPAEFLSGFSGNEKLSPVVTITRY